jgi:hypothetical protein
MECEEIPCDKAYKTRDPTSKICELSPCGVDYEARNEDGTCEEIPCSETY